MEQVLVYVVVELVVAAQSNQRSQTETVREENLRYGINPHLCENSLMLDYRSKALLEETNLRFTKLGQIRAHVEFDTLERSRQSNATDQQDSQQEVREQGSEVHDLTGPFDSLPDAEVAQNPHQQKSSGQLPTDRSNLIDTTGDHQRASPGSEIVTSECGSLDLRSV